MWRCLRFWHCWSLKQQPLPSMVIFYCLSCAMFWEVSFRPHPSAFLSTDGCWLVVESLERQRLIKERIKDAERESSLLDDAKMDNHELSVEIRAIQLPCKLNIKPETTYLSGQPYLVCQVVVCGVVWHLLVQNSRCFLKFERKLSK